MNDPRLTRFVLLHSAIGATAGIVFVVLLIAFDVANVGSLVLASDVGMLASAVLAAFFAITFGSVQVGVALTLTFSDNEPKRPNGLAILSAEGARQPAAARVTVAAGPSRRAARPFL